MILENIFIFLDQPKLYELITALMILPFTIIGYIRWVWLFYSFLIYFISTSYYNLYWSPLKSIPGPWYTAISELWLTSHILRLRRVRAIDDLFRKYGPIVRVAPNKVYFLNVQTMRHVYGVSAKLSKSAIYKGFLIHDNNQALSILDPGPHMIRLKGFAPHYTPANLTTFQPEMHEFTLKLVENLCNQGGFVAYDAISLISHLMIDVNCLHLFGYRVDSIVKWASTLSNNVSTKSDPFSTAIHDFPQQALLKSTLPRLLWFFISNIPIPRWYQLCKSDRFVGKFVTTRVQNEVSRMNAGKGDLENSERMSLISRLLRYHIQTEDKLMDSKDVISEATGHLIAAVDTTAITTAYIFWELSRRQDVVKKLREEIDLIMVDRNVIPDIQELNELPYLNAVITEGLRLYTSAPSPLERYVPQNSSSSPFTLLGYELPPGTIIASQAWSSHRVASVFPEPERFKPSRWLGGSKGLSCNNSKTNAGVDATMTSISLTELAAKAEKGSEIASDNFLSSSMQAHMFPFGYGPRICGGQNLAMMMFRIVIATFVRNFDIVAGVGTNETSMYIMESFVTFPAAMQCKLNFVPRQN